MKLAILAVASAISALAMGAQLRLASADTTTLTTFRDGNNVDHDLTPAYFKVDQASTTISAAQATATLAREELAEYKTHVAETYVTKAGMQEQTAQIISAVNGVKSDVSGLNERIDRILENRPQRSG